MITWYVGKPKESTGTCLAFQQKKYGIRHFTWQMNLASAKKRKKLQTNLFIFKTYKSGGYESRFLYLAKIKFYFGKFRSNNFADFRNKILAKFCRKCVFLTKICKKNFKISPSCAGSEYFFIEYHAVLLL
jgi:hypothetical protein